MSFTVNSMLPHELDVLRSEVESHLYPLVFATISGAHLYGFPSPNSDFDLRGVHLLPIEECVGLTKGPETLEKSGHVRSIELDLVTHELEKFVRLMLKPNGYVMEQLLSPIVVRTSNLHDELKTLAPHCLTKHYVHHYVGFAANQRKLLLKDNPPRIKPALYTYRVLLSGIHLMRTGKIEANLIRLNEENRLPMIDDLIHRKRTEEENATLPCEELEVHEREFQRLLKELHESANKTHLPDSSGGRSDLHDLLVRARMQRTPLEILDAS